VSWVESGWLGTLFLGSSPGVKQGAYIQSGVLHLKKDIAPHFLSFHDSDIVLRCSEGQRESPRTLATQLSRVMVQRRH
jgi:hypothetical protein